MIRYLCVSVPLCDIIKAMTVLKAQVMGFCMGVRRAVDLAFEEARNAVENGTSVFTIGPLIHNPKVLADLKTAGIQILPPLSDYSRLTANCSLIIRAHGISPAFEKELRNTGCRIVDATCPKVKANQLKIQELLRDGYFLFLAGTANHAEIEGLLGYALETAPQDSLLTNCVLTGNAEEARKEAENQFKKNKKIKTALLSQTTISGDEYNAIGNEIKKFFSDLKIIDTICAATSERQKALRELLPQVGAVIIVGGEDSANTQNLLAIAEESGKPCVLAEDEEGVPEEFYKFEKVGISAGASTPDDVVDGILEKLTRRHRGTGIE